MSDPQISAAKKALESGKRREARRLLGQMVQTDPDNAEAWWYLHQAVEDPAQRAHCLRQTIRLRPDHTEARRLLADLDRRITPGKSAHTIKRQVLDVTDERGRFVAVPSPTEEPQATPEELQDLDGKRPRWFLRGALIAALVIGLAGVIGIIVIGGKITSDQGGVTIIAPTVPALVLAVENCTISGSSNATLIFTNESPVTIELVQGATGSETLLASLQPGGAFTLQTQPDVQIRYAARTSDPVLAGGGALIEIPRSNTCHVAIR